MTKRALVTAWILTPVVVWAGAFFMGWLGAWLGEQLTWLVVGGVAGGLIALIVWSALIIHLRNRGERKSEKVQEENKPC